jgi:segregation and condensation protein B
MDDITKVLEERQKQLLETPTDSTNPTGVEELVSAIGEPDPQFPTPDTQYAIPNTQPSTPDTDSSPATGSGMTLVAAIEGTVEPEPAQPPKPTREQIVEALLFAATSPLPESRVREIAGCDGVQVADSVAALNQQYEVSGRAFRIHRIAQGYQLYTLPEYSEWVKALFKTHRTLRLSKPSLETLAIVAYKQPITKPEIEQYRGVDATAPLITLLERKLIVLAGRAHKPGNPFLYRTSKEFMRYFGLGSLDDLPRPEELEAFLRRREEQAEAEDAALIGTDTEDVTVPRVPLEDSAGEPVSRDSEEAQPRAEESAPELDIVEAAALVESAGVPPDA